MVNHLAIKELKPHPKNPNKHSKEQIGRLAALIKYQGWRLPIIVSKQSGFIVSGHGRLEAAKLMGLKEVPVSLQDFTSDEQELAFLVSDNAIASWAELDLASINSFVPDLGPEFDIDLLGIEDFEIEPADKIEPQCDEDEVPEYVEPKTKIGDCYRLGNHRLLCGDATSIDAVDKLMDGQKADMVFTSPPYNANIKFGSFVKQRIGKKLYGDTGYEDDMDSKGYTEFCSLVLENCFLHTDGFIFWNVSYNANSRFEYISQIKNRLEFLIEQICWIKSNSLPFKGSLKRDWEPIYIFSTDKKPLGLHEVKSNRWEVNNSNSQHSEHKACFPVELPERAINLIDSQSVLDPFGGSGTTLIASEKTQRKCFMMELDPHYCDVIVARWEQYTGKKAELINGQT